MRVINVVFIMSLFLVGLSGCMSDADDSNATPDGDQDTSQEPDGDVDAERDADDDSLETDILSENETEEAPEGPFHDPWMVMASDELPPQRGFIIKRGIIHSHSPYSHDACDDEPFIDGVRNETCFEDCRTGMCLTAQDFVFLTDHDDLFAEYEYPEVLLYQQGDELIERGGLPVANRVVCEDGRRVIVAAGTETGMMPIGLEHHVAETIEERKIIYNSKDADAIHAMQAAGGLVFLQHTEGWEVETILDLPIDGIEMFNLHQNLMDNMGAAIGLLLRMDTEPEAIPEVELAIIGIFQESEADLFRWSKALMQKPLPAILATDAHRNVFKNPSPDGERIDSFRRMMHWFSNYVLIPEGEVDDAVLKQAIAHGRLYGAFDYLGYPVGFDFHAEVAETVYEMGDHILAGSSAQLSVTLPQVYRLDPNGPQPILSARILKADDGEWEVVAEGGHDLEIAVESGIYRSEVRIVPEHLRPWLGNEADTYIHEIIWVYSNPIYIGVPY